MRNFLWAGTSSPVLCTDVPQQSLDCAPDVPLCQRQLNSATGATQRCSVRFVILVLARWPIRPEPSGIPPGLVTGNRNDDGPDSLEATLRAQNKETSLPVFTLVHPDHIRPGSSETVLAAGKLLEHLLEIDRYRGAGRNWLV
jgi:hypothetical protein